MTNKKFRFFILLFTLIISTLFISPVLASISLPERHLITINKATNQLVYYYNEELIKTFPVGTGKTAILTPKGTFTVVAKFVNPFYRAGNIAGGSPNNPLGVRWLGLDVGNTGGAIYGIHGTNNPASIGEYVSAGCVRMYNEDVTWLYAQVPLGTPVKIIDEPWDLGPTMPTWWGNKKTPIQLQTDQVVLVNESEFVPSQITLPFLLNNELMLPLRAIVQVSGIEITYDPEKKLIALFQENNNALIDIKTSTFHSSQGLFKLSPQVTVINGVSFVPLKVFKYLNINVRLINDMPDLLP